MSVDRMAQQRSSLRAVATVLAVLVPIVAVAGFAFTWVLNNQEAHLTKMRFRELSGISREVGFSVSALQKAYETLAATVGKTCDPNERRGREWTAVALKCSEPPPGVEEAAGTYLTADGPWLYIGRPGFWTRVSLGVLIDRAAEARSLSEVVLATADGTPLYRRGRLDVANVRDLIGARDDHEGTKDTDKDGGANTPAQLTPGHVAIATLFDEPHRLFVVPMRLPVKWVEPDGKIAAEPPLRLCSVEPKERIAEQAQAIPLNWLLLMLCALVLAMLAWPLLKLWYVGPRERFEGVDVKLLVLGAVVAAGVFTFLLHVVPEYRAIRVAFDGQLKEVAATVITRFRDELTDAQRALHATVRGAGAGDFQAYRHMVLFDADGRAVRWWFPEPKLAADGTVSWGGVEKTQLGLNVVDRDFFRKARQRQYWGLGLETDPTGEAASDGFTIEALRSRLTGEHDLILGTSVPASSGGVVSGVALDLRTVRDPVLAPGFRFALVDFDGDVRLHSDNSRNAREDLFEECDRDRGLIAMVQARRAGFVDATCYGDHQRLYTTPILGTPWSVVVFNDTRLLQAANGELVVAWVALFGVYALILMGVLFVLQAVFPDYRAPWLWPRNEHAVHYVGAAARLVLIGLVAVLWTSRYGGMARQIAIVTVPAVALALLCLLLEPERIEGRIAGGVMAGGGLVLLALAVGARDVVGVATVLAVGGLCVLDTINHRRSRSAAIALAVGGAAVLALSRLPLDGVPLLVGAGASAAAGLGASWVAQPSVRSRLAGLRARVVHLVRDRVSARNAHVTMLLALLLVVAIVPATVFFRDARQYARTVLVKQGQYKFTKEMMRRAKRIRTEAAVAHPGDAPLVDALVAERLADTRDVYRSSWLGWPTSWLFADGDSEAPPCSEVDAMCGQTASGRTSLTHGLLRFLPAFGPLAPHLRAVSCRGAADGAWCWARSDPEFALEVRDDGMQGFLGKGYPPRFVGDPTAPVPWRTPVIVLCWIAASFAAAALVLSIVKLVFVLEADAGVAAATGPWRNVFVYTLASDPTGGPVAESPGARVIDLRIATDGSSWDSADLSTWPPVVEVDRLEAVLADPTLAEAARRLIRRLLVAGKRVVLTSEVDPLEYLEGQVEELVPAPKPEGDANAKSAPAPAPTRTRESAAWSTLLGSFVRARVRVDGHAPAPLRERYVDATCDDQLDHAANDDRLHGRNAGIWTSCTPAARLALRQLAEEGFMNPRDTKTARELLSRGLVRRTPAFTILDASFRRFVLRAMTADEVAVLERSAAPSGWSKLRGPLFVLVMIVAAFFFVTQRSQFNSVLTMATALAGAVPLVRMLTAASDDKNATSARA
jgi:hypothetical protein